MLLNEAEHLSIRARMDVYIHPAVRGLRSAAASKVRLGAKVTQSNLKLPAKSSAGPLVVFQRRGNNYPQVGTFSEFQEGVVRVEAPYRVVNVLERFRVSVLRHLCLLTVKLKGRPQAPKGRRRPRRAARGDHLRARTAMSAAIMTMKSATTAADFISYSETLTAPRRWPFTDPSNDC